MIEEFFLTIQLLKFYYYHITPIVAWHYSFFQLKGLFVLQVLIKFTCWTFNF